MFWTPRIVKRPEITKLSAAQNLHIFLASIWQSTHSVKAIRFIFLCNFPLRNGVWDRHCICTLVVQQGIMDEAYCFTLSFKGNHVLSWCKCSWFRGDLAVLCHFKRICKWLSNNALQSTDNISSYADMLIDIDNSNHNSMYEWWRDIAQCYNNLDTCRSCRMSDWNNSCFRSPPCANQAAMWRNLQEFSCLFVISSGSCKFGTMCQVMQRKQPV